MFVIRRGCSAALTRSAATGSVSDISLRCLSQSGSRQASPFVASTLLFQTQRRDGHGSVVKQDLLPVLPAIVRFAPSPTGYLHLGSLRTALFNYLLAKRTGGQFILRIEDTDQKRLVADAEQRLQDDLRWAGIYWDQGPGINGPHQPYRQSERTSTYQTHADELVRAKAAFRCFCPADSAPASSIADQRVDLDLAANSASGCHSACHELPVEHSERKAENGDKHVIRLRRDMAVPKWHDLVYGKIEPSRKVGSPRPCLADSVLLKSDGTPTYHLANVVDDHAMQITHVMRGAEWMSSTALHVALYNAFGWTVPQFVHVGLLTDFEGNKLSKRKLDTDIRSLREQGSILPETIVNFLALLGWRNPSKGDVMSMERMIDVFDLKFTRGNTIVSMDKLRFLQRHHAKARIQHASSNEAAFAELVQQVKGECASRCTDVTVNMNGRDVEPYIKAVLFADSEYYESPKQFVDRNSFFFDATEHPDVLASKPEVVEIARRVFEDNSVQTALQLWNGVDGETSSKVLADKIHQAASSINSCILRVSQDHIETHDGGAKELGTTTSASSAQKALAKDIHAFFRLKLTGGKSCPSTGHVMAVLGHRVCTERFKSSFP